MDEECHIFMQKIKKQSSQYERTVHDIKLFET